MQENKIHKIGNIDGVVCKTSKPKNVFCDWSLVQKVKGEKCRSTVFLNGEINKRNLVFERHSIIPSRLRLDSLGQRIYVEREKKLSLTSPDVNLNLIKSRCLDAKCTITGYVRDWVRGLTLVKMWNMSLVGAIIFGMLTMTMLYRYLGGSVVASSRTGERKPDFVIERDIQEEELDEEEYEMLAQLFQDYYQSEKESQKAEFEEILKVMVKGYPIEDMIPEIVKQDRIVAALLVAIARKESSWGRRVPVLNGGDCFNYWGYRGIRDRMGTGGHTCFDSRADAVETVAKRIKYLVTEKKLNTPSKMIVWKCGDCSWDTQSAMNKWISDVDHYFQQLNDLGSLTKY